MESLPSCSLRRLVMGAVIIGAAQLPATLRAQELSDVRATKDPLVLRGQGSFFVDGDTHFVSDSFTGTTAGRAGNSMINQMYVQFQKPADRNNEWAIVFVHGCCLSSKTWETTPDGRMGWNEYFTRQGFDTYMADQVGRARSGFDAKPINEVRAGTRAPADLPAVLIATDKFAWDVFRFGDYSTLTPWPDERFPMRTVMPGGSQTFYKQVIPDMTAYLTASPPGCSGGSCAPTDPSAFWHTPAAMSKLAKGLGGAILVGHSQSSSFPTRAALLNPEGVKGIIQLETGCFGNLTPANIDVLKKIPILIMEGDHYATPRPVEPCPTEISQIEAAGGDITYIHLPDIGIHGNSHMFMQDNNNIQIADIVIHWINRHVEARRGGHGHR